MLVLNTFDTLLVSQALVKKKLACLPTDTLYALCADAYSDEAVEKVYLAKKREFNKSLPIFVGSIEQAFSIGEFNEESIKLAERFWPGPLTIVVSLKKQTLLSSLVTAGQNSIAIRIPANEELVDFLKAYKKPITATSANLSSTNGNINEIDIIKDIGEHIEVLVKSKRPIGFNSSTIVTCVNGDSVSVLRKGVIAVEEISKVLSLTI